MVSLCISDKMFYIGKWKKFSFNILLIRIQIMKTKFFRFVVMCTLMLSCTAVSPSYGDWPEVFTSANGLPDDNVYSLKFDRNGVMWAGTGKGLARYDGTLWMTYTTADGLPSNIVTAIDFDREGRLVIGMNEPLAYAGIVVFRAGKWHFIRDEQPEESITRQGECVSSGIDGDAWFLTRDSTFYNDYQLIHYIPSTGEQTTYPIDIYTTALGVGNDGTVWIGGNSEIQSFDGVTWKKHRIGELNGYFVKRIKSDSYGTLWILCNKSSSLSDYRLISYNGETAKVHTVKFPTEIDDGPDGNVWICTFEDGIYKTLNGTAIEKAFNTPGITSLFDIAVGPDLSVWCANSSSIVCRYSVTGELTFQRTVPGTGSDAFHSSAVDSNGVAWFATYRGLLSCDGEKIFQHAQEGPVIVEGTTTPVTEQNLIFSVDTGSDGSVFCATIPNYFSDSSDRFSGGVARFNGETWEKWTSVDGLINNGVNTVAIDSTGAVWAGTEKGISRFDGVSWESFTSDVLPNGRVLSLYVASDNNVWAGTHGHDKNGWTASAAQFNGETWTTVTRDEIRTLGVSVITEASDGSILLGGGYMDIHRYDAGTWIHYDDQVGVLKYPHSAFVNDEGVWFGTISKILRYRDGIFYHHPIAGGYYTVGGHVTSIAGGPDGSIWVGCERQGIHRVLMTDVGVEEPAEKPTEIVLHGNAPNPFNPDTFISFTLPSDENVRITVYDITGREAARLVDSRMSAGTHRIVFNGEDLASGVYFYRLESKNRVSTGKMLLLK